MPLEICERVNPICKHVAQICEHIAPVCIRVAGGTSNWAFELEEILSKFTWQDGTRGSNQLTLRLSLIQVPGGGEELIWAVA